MRVRAAAIVTAVLMLIVSLDVLAGPRRRRRRRVIVPITINMAAIYPKAVKVNKDTLHTTDSMTTVYNYFRNIYLNKGYVAGWKVVGHTRPRRSDWLYFSLRKKRERAYLWVRKKNDGMVVIRALPLGVRPH